MTGGALASMLGWTASDALSTPRSIFALAQDGYLPARLAHLNPATHSPRNAIAVHLVLVALLASSGTFAALAAICAVVLVVLLIGACLAALRLRQWDIALGGPVRRLPGLVPAAIIGIAAALGVGAQATLAQLGGTVAIMVALTMGFALTRRRHHRRGNGFGDPREAAARS